MNESPADPHADKAPVIEGVAEAPAATDAPRQARPTAPRPGRTADRTPIFFGVGLVVLAVAIFWLWTHPVTPAAAPQDDGQLAQLQQQVAALQQQVAALQARPAPPAPADLRPLDSRIAALEQKPAPQPVTDPALAGRIDDLATQMKAGQDALGNQIGAASQHLQALSDRVTAQQATVSGRLDDDEKRLAAAESVTGRIDQLTAQTQRTARLQAAAVALVAGQKLGDIPGAPAAVTRYAQQAPPTEAALRLSFPTAAKAAEDAAQPVDESRSLGQRMWQTMQQAVTIRQGDHVIVGDPVAGVVGRARHALDAGDLTGAVAALDKLTGAPAQAMAGWLDQAHGLLAARTALTTMAAQS